MTTTEILKAARELPAIASEIKGTVWVPCDHCGDSPKLTLAGARSGDELYLCRPCAQTVAREIGEMLGDGE